MVEQTELNEYEKVERIDVGEIPIRELPKLPEFDPKSYVGRDVVIERVEVREGRTGPYIFAESIVLETFSNGTEVRATKIYGLRKDEEGKLFIAKDSKSYLELQELGVKDWRELKGKTVKLQLTKIIKNEKTGIQRRYLTW